MSDNNNNNNNNNNKIALLLLFVHTTHNYSYKPRRTLLSTIVATLSVGFTSYRHALLILASTCIDSSCFEHPEIMIEEDSLLIY